MFKITDEQEICERLYDYKTPGMMDYKGLVPSILVFLQVGAWTGHMRHAFDELGERYDGKINMYYVDIDKNPEIAKEFGIVAAPTSIFIPIGAPAKVVSGNIQSAVALDELIGKLMPVPVVSGINDTGLQPGQKLIIAH